MSENGQVSNLRDDVSGGLSAAIIALPLALGFGVAAFAPLGPNYAAAGALAGLVGATFTGIFAALFGGTPAQITGPTGPMTVVITATIAKLVGWSEANGEIDVPLVLTLTFATVLLGGLVQILLGILRTGSAIKFIPYPVIAGFMNGIAVIIFIGQIEPVLGIVEGRFYDHFSVNPETLITALATIATIYLARAFVPKLPSSLVGLLVGTCVFFLIGKIASPQLLVFEGNLLIVGEIPTGIPMPKNIGSFVELATNLDPSIIGLVVPPAIVLGILGAIDSLLTSVVADVATRTRHDSNRELIGQGIGNMVASLFGGLSGAGATVRTLVNVDAGGRGRASGVTHGVILLAVLMFLGAAAGWIPMSVLGGILVVTAIGMVDTWSLSLVRKQTAWLDLAVVIVVTIVTVAVDLMVAVAIGFVITTMLFLRDLSAISIVRRTYRCTKRRSKHVRSQREEDILAEMGKDILVYELKGNVFFGSTTGLATEIESQLPGARFLILDLEHVDTIDITGAELLKRIADMVQDAGAELLVSHINPTHRKDREALERYQQELHVVDTIRKDNILASLDRAIEAAEDRVLTRAGYSDADVEAAGSVRNSDLLRQLDDDSFALVAACLQRHEYAAGDVIFSAGETGDSLAIIVHGRVSVYPGTGEHLGLRLATFGPGLHVGEMTLLTKAPRTATVVADCATTIDMLRRDEFERLQAENCHIGIDILAGLSRELVRRLRVTSAELIESQVD